MLCNATIGLFQVIIGLKPKKERPNFYGMFSQNLPNSAALTAILKLKLPQCNAIGVRTPPDPAPITAFGYCFIVNDVMDCGAVHKE